jgi:hypothetical protein
MTRRGLRCRKAWQRPNLDTLAEHGFVEKHRSGKYNHFINVALVKLFLDLSGGP